MPASIFRPFAEMHEAMIKQMARDSGREKFVGYLCTYTPVEIIHAAGFIPVRLFGGPGEIARAYGHVPDFLCPFLKRVMEKATEGAYAGLAGLVQGYTCDAACGIVNILRNRMNGGFAHTLAIPYNDRPDARTFFHSALMELIDRLNQNGGSFTEASLTRSLNLYSRIRQHLLTLYSRRPDGTRPLSPADRMTVMTAGFSIPPDKYLDLLDHLASELTHLPGESPVGIPVLLSGSFVESPDIFSAIQSAGGAVAGDDFCAGYRQLLPIDGRGDSPMDQIIDRYMTRSPCPARTRAISRSANLCGLAIQNGARGIIFVVQKYCTPHLSDIPILSDELRKSGYPVLLIEMDESWEVSGQMRTRLESFFEMIGAAR